MESHPEKKSLSNPEDDYVRIASEEYEDTHKQEMLKVRGESVQHQQGDDESALARIYGKEVEILEQKKAAGKDLLRKKEEVEQKIDQMRREKAKAEAINTVRKQDLKPILEALAEMDHIDKKIAAFQRMSSPEEELSFRQQSREMKENAEMKEAQEALYFAENHRIAQQTSPERLRELLGHTVNPKGQKEYSIDTLTDTILHKFDAKQNKGFFPALFNEQKKKAKKQFKESKNKANELKDTISASDIVAKLEISPLEVQEIIRSIEDAIEEEVIHKLHSHEELAHKVEQKIKGGKMDKAKEIARMGAFYGTIGYAATAIAGPWGVLAPLMVRSYGTYEQWKEHGKETKEIRKEVVHELMHDHRKKEKLIYGFLKKLGDKKAEQIRSGKFPEEKEMSPVRDKKLEKEQEKVKEILEKYGIIDYDILDKLEQLAEEGKFEEIHDFIDQSSIPFSEKEAVYEKIMLISDAAYREFHRSRESADVVKKRLAFQNAAFETFTKKTEADVEKLFEKKDMAGLEDQLVSVGVPQGAAEKMMQDYQQFFSQENDAVQELKRLKDEKLKLQQKIFFEFKSAADSCLEKAASAGNYEKAKTILHTAGVNEGRVKAHEADQKNIKSNEEDKKKAEDREKESDKKLVEGNDERLKWQEEVEKECGNTSVATDCENALQSTDYKTANDILKRAGVTQEKVKGFLESYRNTERKIKSAEEDKKKAKETLDRCTQKIADLQADQLKIQQQASSECKHRVTLGIFETAMESGDAKTAETTLKNAGINDLYTKKFPAIYKASEQNIKAAEQKQTKVTASKDDDFAKRVKNMILEGKTGDLKKAFEKLEFQAREGSFDAEERRFIFEALKKSGIDEPIASGAVYGKPGPHGRRGKSFFSQIHDEKILHEKRRNSESEQNLSSAKFDYIMALAQAARDSDATPVQQAYQVFEEALDQKMGANRPRMSMGVLRIMIEKKLPEAEKAKDLKKKQHIESLLQRIDESLLNDTMAQEMGKIEDDALFFDILTNEEVDNRGDMRLLAETLYKVDERNKLLRDSIGFSLDKGGDKGHMAQFLQMSRKLLRLDREGSLPQRGYEATKESLDKFFDTASGIDAEGRFRSQMALIMAGIGGKLYYLSEGYFAKLGLWLPGMAGGYMMGGSVAEGLAASAGEKKKHGEKRSRLERIFEKEYQMEDVGKLKKALEIWEKNLKFHGVMESEGRQAKPLNYPELFRVFNKAIEMEKVLGEKDHHKKEGLEKARQKVQNLLALHSGALLLESNNIQLTQELPQQIKRYEASESQFLKKKAMARVLGAALMGPGLSLVMKPIAQGVIHGTEWAYHKGMPASVQDLIHDITHHPEHLPPTNVIPSGDAPGNRGVQIEPYDPAEQPQPTSSLVPPEGAAPLHEVIAADASATNTAAEIVSHTQGGTETAHHEEKVASAVQDSKTPHRSPQQNQWDKEMQETLHAKNISDHQSGSENDSVRHESRPTRRILDQMNQRREAAIMHSGTKAPHEVQVADASGRVPFGQHPPAPEDTASAAPLHEASADTGSTTAETSADAVAPAEAPAETGYNPATTIKQLDGYLVQVNEGKVPVEHTRFDSSGKIVEVKFGDDSLVYHYDKQGRVDSVDLFEQAGTVKEGSVVFDDNGKMIERHFFSEKITDTEGKPWERKMEDVYYYKDGKVAQADRFAFDKKGNPFLGARVKRDDFGHDIYREIYTTKGDLHETQEFEYNKNGQREWEAKFDKDHALKEAIKMKYDGENHLTEKQFYTSKEGKWYGNIAKFIGLSNKYTPEVAGKIEYYHPESADPDKAVRISQRVFEEKTGQLKKEVITWTESGAKVERSPEFSGKDPKPDGFTEKSFDTTGHQTGERKIVLQPDGKTPASIKEYRMTSTGKGEGAKILESTMHYELSPDGTRFHEVHEHFDADGKNVTEKEDLFYNRRGHLEGKLRFDRTPDGKGLIQTEQETYKVDEKGAVLEKAIYRLQKDGTVSGIEVNGKPITEVAEMQKFLSQQDVYDDKGKLVIDREPGKYPLRYIYKDGKPTSYEVLGVDEKKVLGSWQARYDDDQITGYEQLTYEQDGSRTIIYYDQYGHSTKAVKQFLVPGFKDMWGNDRTIPIPKYGLEGNRKFDPYQYLVPPGETL